jgi:hypothetical protein
MNRRSPRRKLVATPWGDERYMRAIREKQDIDRESESETENEKGTTKKAGRRRRRRRSSSSSSIKPVEWDDRKGKRVDAGAHVTPPSGRMNNHRQPSDRPMTSESADDGDITSPGAYDWSTTTTTTKTKKKRRRMERLSSRGATRPRTEDEEQHHWEHEASAQRQRQRRRSATPGGASRVRKSMSFGDAERERGGSTRSMTPRRQAAWW